MTFNPLAWRLFDMSNFIPHGMCLDWDQDLIVFSILGDAVTAAAYLWIPLQLLATILRIKNGERLVLSNQGGTIGLFAAFILCCGLTHAMHVVTLFEPLYRLATAWTLVTAGVSVMTAATLQWVFRTETQVESDEFRDLAVEHALQETELGLIVEGKMSVDASRRLRARLEAGSPERVVLRRVMTAAAHGELTAKQLVQIEEVLAG